MSEDTESLICPFCSKVLVEDINEIAADNIEYCKHYISEQDDYVNWGDDNYFIEEINNIVEHYIEDASKGILESLTEGLKIDKEITIDGSWDWLTIEGSVPMLSDDIIVVHEQWGGDRPGASGTFKHLFINDINKVKWLFDELKVLHDRLLKYDKENDSIM